MKRYTLKETPPRPGGNAFKIPYADVLNPAQHEAVTTRQGPILVIAGAGSGKTRTLTYRVARLVEEGVPPGAILLLTFTRKAATEMLRRAAVLLDNRCERVAGGTFHSFANLILRKYADKLGYPSGFNILDRADSEDVISLLRTRLHLHGRDRRFPKKRTIATIFSKAVNKEMSVEDIVFEGYPNFIGDITDLLRLKEGYGAHKKKHAVMDYDDLLANLRVLLEGWQDIRERMSDTYRYIMVDEYQDTNKIQADIVRALAETHNNVMVVGDDSQCVYAFRGANFGNIMEFPEEFPGTKIIKLEENYRSTQQILDLTNVIIDRAKQKYTKALYTRRAGGVRPGLVMARDERMQSQFVVQRILELHEEGVSFGDVAVLFRSSFHSYDLEIELNKSNIPFVKVGGFKFMEAAHVKDLLAHMKVLANPKDSISWHRILLLLENIGPKAATEIFQGIMDADKGVHGLSAVKPKPRYAEPFERLRETMSGLDMEGFSVAEIGETVFRYYEPVLKQRFDNYPKRARDLEHLLTIMEQYNSMDTFLADMALEPPNASVNNILATDDQEDKLVLSTIHSAKGLEWHTVFVLWALEGRFPSLYAARSEAEMEEELRLTYVAASRAKENLYFIYPINIYDRSTAMIMSKPSRFIDGIAEDILEPWSLGESFQDPFFHW